MTPTEFAQYVERVKDRLLEIVAGELVPPPSDPPAETERVPKVIKWLVADSVPRTYAARLRSDRHVVKTEVEGQTVAEQQVHAFVLAYGGLETYVPPEPSNAVRSVFYKLRFTLDSYYQDYPGSDKPPAEGELPDNAEARHGAEIARAAHALLSARPLGVEGAKRVTGWRERRGLARIGEVPVKESLGEFFVELSGIHIPV